MPDSTLQYGLLAIGAFFSHVLVEAFKAKPSAAVDEESVDSRQVGSTALITEEAGQMEDLISVDGPLFITSNMNLTLATPIVLLHDRSSS